MSLSSKYLISNRKSFSYQGNKAEPEFDFQSFQHDLLEVIGAFSKVLGAQSVIPPFSATALLAGDSHIVTFDQMYYDFASQGCSYLLASDFSNGKFSAIANYDEEMSRTSIGEYSACLLDALMHIRTFTFSQM